MKRLLLIVSLILMAGAVSAQNEWKNLVKLYGGVQIGINGTGIGSTKVVDPNSLVGTIDSVSFNSLVTPTSFKLWKNGVQQNPDVPSTHYVDNDDYYVKLLVDTLYDATTVDTLALTDAGKICRYNNAAQTKVYVPTNATVPFPIGTQIHIKMDGTGIVGILGCAGVVLESELDSAYINNRHGWATIIKRATNKWDRLGSLKD